MSTTFPGTTIEVSKLKKGSSRVMFDGIFAAGGITLSQVSIMTGLEQYMIQNWVKRGFVSSPVKRVYSRKQFARIIIINMLKESLQIEKICQLIRIIEGVLEDDSDDLIPDDELYHTYVDLLSENDVTSFDSASVESIAQKAVSSFDKYSASDKKKLSRIFQVMIYAHASSQLRRSADMILATIL